MTKINWKAVAATLIAAPVFALTMFAPDALIIIVLLVGLTAICLIYALNSAKSGMVTETWVPLHDRPAPGRVLTEEDILEASRLIEERRSKCSTL